MSTNVGDLNVDLTFTDKGYTVTVNKAGQVLREFSQNLKSTDATMKQVEASHESLLTSFRHFVVMLGAARFAMMDFNDVVLSIPRNVIKVSGEMERLTFLMKGLSKEVTSAGKAAEAQRGFAFIMNMAQNAPFQIKTLTDAFVKFKAAGLDPMDGSLQALTDSVARFGGDSETMHRAAIAIQQMAGKGVISMEELRQQLGEAVPDAMKMMAEGAGYTMQAFVKAVSKGAVQAPEALERMFFVMKLHNAGAARDMMETWSGLTQQLTTQWHLLEQQAGGGFFQSIKEAAKSLSDSLKGDDVKRFAFEIGQDLATATKYGLEFIKQLYEMRNIIKDVGEGFIVFMALSKIREWSTQAIPAFVRPYQAAMAAAKAAKETELATITEVAMAQQIAAERAFAESATRISSAQTEANRLVAIKAQQLEEIAAMEAAANTGSRVRQVGVLLGSGGQGLSVIRQQVAETEALIAVQRAEQAAAVAANAEHAVSVARLSEQSLAASNAARSVGMLAAAGGVLRGAISALGGPFGLLLTAISVGIPLWMEFGNRGKEAIEKIQNALKSGTASRDTLAINQQRQQDLEKQISDKMEFIQQLSKNAPTSVRNTAQQQLVKLKAQQAQLLLEQTAIITQMSDNEVKVGEQEAQKRIDAAVKQETDVFNSRRAAINKAASEFDKDPTHTAAQREAQAEKTEKELSQLNREQAQRLSEIATKFNADYEKALAKMTEPGAKFDGAALNRAKGMAKTAQDALNQYAEMARQGSRFITPMQLQQKNQKDPLTKAAEDAKTRMDEAMAKLLEIEDGTRTFGEVYKRSVQKVEDMRVAGHFNKTDSKGHVTTPGADDPLLRLEAYRNAITEIANTNSAGLKTVNKDLAQSFEELAAASDRFYNPENAQKQATGVLKIQSDLAKLKSTLISDKDEMLSQLISDQLNGKITPEHADEIVAQIQKIGNALKTFDDDARQVVANKALSNMMGFADDLRKNAGADLAASIQDPMERATAEFESKRKEMIDKFNVMRDQIIESSMGAFGLDPIAFAMIATGWDSMTQSMEASSKRFFQEHKSQLDRLMDDWNDTAKGFDGVAVRSFQTAADAMVEFAKTGKFSFGDMTVSILADILKIELQAQMAKTFRELFGNSNGFMSAIGKLFGGGMTSNGTLGSSGPGGAGYGFAEGGIMTGQGPVPLRKYAMGGVARSPQAAIFGEGTRPEAYVPLPDGRSIPVTMQGKGPNVIVNVINQSGQPVNAEQGQPRFDGQQLILDVVLSAAARPGPFRDQMRQAVK